MVQMDMGLELGRPSADGYPDALWSLWLSFTLHK